jgi:transposase
MNSTLIHQIVTLFTGGASIRRIAHRLQISRRTVRRALLQLEQARTTGPPGESPRPAPPRGSQLDAHEAAIAALLARHPEITARRIYEELRRLGYTGGYTILSERVRRMRPRPVVAPVRRFETAPGFHYGKSGVMFSDAEGTGLPCPESVVRFP